MLSRSRFSRCLAILAAIAAGWSLLLVSGCTSLDYLQAASRSLERAWELEPPSAFFAPTIARALGDPAPPPMPPRAKQHYLSVIYYLEGLSVSGEQELERQGLLGEAFVLKTLALWRLGRLAEARTAALRAKASGQEALNARDRALFTAFDGIVQLEGALDAIEAGQGYTEILPAIAGEGGAWRRLGAARAEARGGDESLQIDLIQTRLAAFVVLRDAREKLPPEARPPRDETWERLAAEAEVELRELAALPAADPAAHAALVQSWSARCGLAPAAG